MSKGLAALSPAIFAPADRKLTAKQASFAALYVNLGGDQKAAAVAAGYPEASASAAASRLMRNPLVQQEILKQTLQEIGLRAVPALKTVAALSTLAKSEYVRLEAAKDLLDRAGFRPPDRVDMRLDASLSVTLDIGQGG